MTRLLVWNIETFSVNTIEDPDTSTKKKGIGGNTADQAAFERFHHIQTVFVSALPDVVVILEVGSGELGVQGAERMLQYLRGAPLFEQGDWRMVPPLRVGMSSGSKPETVAVLYRGVTDLGFGQTVTRYFTGPNLWMGGYEGPSVERGPPTPYPSKGVTGTERDLNAMLVPPDASVRRIPDKALHNAGRGENVVAARTAFHINNPDDTGGSLLEWGPFRPPFMTTFTEVYSSGNVRHLTIFAVHSPTKDENQSVLMTQLGHTWEIVGAQRGNIHGAETRVVCGDFNLRLLNEDGSHTGAYAALVMKDYQLLLGPPPGPPPNPPGGFAGYYATHIRDPQRTQNSRFMWDESPGARSYYPGFHYAGSQHGSNLGSLDNILVRPFDPAASYETTVMNTVVGSPMNAVVDQNGEAPGGASMGTLYLPPLFDDPELLPTVGPAGEAGPYPGGAAARSITGWANYGRILSVRDHFALYANIP